MPEDADPAEEEELRANKVIFSDLTAEQGQVAVSCVNSQLNDFKTEKDVATALKKEFDTKYGVSARDPLNARMNSASAQGRDCTPSVSPGFLIVVVKGRDIVSLRASLLPQLVGCCFAPLLKQTNQSLANQIHSERSSLVMQCGKIGNLAGYCGVVLRVFADAQNKVCAAFPD